MLSVYQTLAGVAVVEYDTLVEKTAFIGGTPASPNKLRLTLVEGSFIDIWLSAEGDYSYHWERRRQSGQTYRWDNAPHYPHLGMYPAHFHDGEESSVHESSLNANPESAIREVLEFVRQMVG